MIALLFVSEQEQVRVVRQDRRAIEVAPDRPRSRWAPTGSSIVIGRPPGGVDRRPMPAGRRRAGRDDPGWRSSSGSRSAGGVRGTLAPAASRRTRRRAPLFVSESFSSFIAATVLRSMLRRRLPGNLEGFRLLSTPYSSRTPWSVGYLRA